MRLFISPTDDRTVEQATALARAADYRVVGRVIDGEPYLVFVR